MIKELYESECNFLNEHSDHPLRYDPTNDSIECLECSKTLITFIVNLDNKED